MSEVGDPHNHYVENVEYHLLAEREAIGPRDVLNVLQRATEYVGKVGRQNVRSEPIANVFLGKQIDWLAKSGRKVIKCSPYSN